MIAAASALAGTGACATTSTGPAPATLSETAVHTGAGITTVGALAGGGVLVVDLWATWCEACAREMPKLDELARVYADRNLTVVGVNVGEEPAQAREFARRMGIGYPLVYDPERRFSEDMGVSRLPTLLVVAADGSIAYRGHALDRDALAAIERQLDAPKR